MNLQGTTSSKFTIGKTTVFVGTAVDPIVGDMIVREGSWEQFTALGWVPVEKLGNVSQHVSDGVLETILDMVDFVLVNVDHRMTLLLPSGRNGQKITVKDVGGLAGRFPITVGSFTVNSNYGGIETVFADGQWRLVKKVDNVISADNGKVNIDLESFTADQDHI